MRHGSSQNGFRLLAAAAVMLAAAGCIHYTARISVGPDGAVTVKELIVPDREWRAEAADSLGATQNLIKEYVDEARTRGGEAKGYGLDSAVAVFRYPSLAAFARSWPDSADNRSQWDRCVHRRVQHDGRDCEELVLFRMSPPDPREKLPNQRNPVLDFVLELPAEAETTNAHAVSGRRYGWRFTEQMQRVDSVWVVWPAAAVK